VSYLRPEQTFLWVICLLAPLRDTRFWDQNFMGGFVSYFGLEILVDVLYLGIAESGDI
jgi:hypothetical protein